VVRLTARVEPGSDGNLPELAELKATLEELERELDRLAGPAPTSGATARAERGLAELVETYRPRQRELIDLLREEGEISVREHELLAANLPSVLAPPPVAREVRPQPAGVAPPPAAPIPAERGLPAARAVPELLRTYQIASLRQAGAVRARRQISFAEYMALKRHFEAAEEPVGDDGPSRQGA
jgi:hypothetical protein